MKHYAEGVLDVMFASELPVGLAVLDRELRFVRINETLARFNGVPVEQSLGRRVPDVLPAAYPKVAGVLREILDGTRASNHIRVEVEVPASPGTLSEWEASYFALHDAEGAITGLLAFAVNISSERRLQVAYRESATHLQRVLNSLFTFVGVMTPDGILREANRAPLEAAGVQAEDVIGLPIWDTYWWSYDPAMQNWLREATVLATQGAVIRQDVVARMAGDTRMPLDFMLAPMRDDEGRVTHLIPSAIDITARKAEEARATKTMVRFQRTFESSPVGKALLAPPGCLALVNPAFCELYGYSADQLFGRDVTELIPELAAPGSTSLAALFQASAAPNEVLRARMRGRRSDGREVETELTVNRLGDTDEGQLLLTVADITERLRAQRDLEASLREKTVLLNEVHHRVKNNLQVISSLLRLQARTAEPAVRAALDDSMMRLRAMALTHQLLYESRDFAALRLNVFLTRLVGLLRETYQVSEDTMSVDASALPEGQEISLSQAVPCGLLVNEIVSNAVKHAFPDRDDGKIEIEACLLAARRVSLTVRDDGIGIGPEHHLGEGASLGFQLIPLLAAQIDAQVTLETTPGGGSLFRLNFPIGEIA